MSPEATSSRTVSRNMTQQSGKLGWVVNQEGVPALRQPLDLVSCGRRVAERLFLEFLFGLDFQQSYITTDQSFALGPRPVLYLFFPREGSLNILKIFAISQHHRQPLRRIPCRSQGYSTTKTQCWSRYAARSAATRPGSRISLWLRLLDQQVTFRYLNEGTSTLDMSSSLNSQEHTGFGGRTLQISHALVVE